MTLLAQDFKFASNTKTGPSAAASDTTDVYQEIIPETKGIGALYGKKEAIKMFPWKFLRIRPRPLSVQVVVEKVPCFDALIA